MQLLTSLSHDEHRTQHYFCKLRSGATTMYLAWGPTVAAGTVTYRTAILLGAACQLFGATILGPRHLPTYLGILHPGVAQNLSPDLVMYAHLIVACVTPVWQLLALWQQAPTANYLGTGVYSIRHSAALHRANPQQWKAVFSCCVLAVFSLVGTACLYPGPDTVDFGSPLLEKPPYLSGLGPVYMSWMFVPTLALICVALFFLTLRTFALRGDDPFYSVLWVCLHGQQATITCIYAIPTHARCRHHTQS